MAQDLRIQGRSRRAETAATKGQQQYEGDNKGQVYRRGGALAEGVRPAYMWFLEFSRSSKCTAATAGPSSFRAAIWSSVELSAGPRAADIPARPRHIATGARWGCPSRRMLRIDSISFAHGARGQRRLECVLCSSARGEVLRPALTASNTVEGAAH